MICKTLFLFLLKKTGEGMLLNFHFQKPPYKSFFYVHSWLDFYTVEETVAYTV